MRDAKLIAGIDEAGRGAVLGPLVIAGISIEPQKQNQLKKMGVKDSKLLTPQKREKLAKSIESLAIDSAVFQIEACKIDNYRREGISLNKLEAMRFADIANFFSPHRIYIDCPETSTEKHELFLRRLLKGQASQTRMFIEHKADSKYPVVAAASIIAKVSRDEEIKKLAEKYGSIGSGYPSDPITVEWLNSWLATNKKFPDCVRNSWITAELIKSEKSQSRLTGFFRGRI